LMFAALPAMASLRETGRSEVVLVFDV